MNIFKVIAKVLKEPTDFFKKVGKGKNHLGFAFGYYALLSLFATITGTLIAILSFYFILPTLTNIPGFEKILGLTLGNFSTLNLIFRASIGYVIGLGAIFVFVGIIHLWILIFGGKNKYAKTFELVVYAGTPAMLLRWVPFIGFVSSIWSFILLIIGTEQVHQINRTRAILMYLIPLVVLIFLGIIIGIIIFLTVGKIFAGGLTTLN